MKAWLRKQPREVSVALAARAALRVVPVMHMAERAEDYANDLVLPVFRAAAVAWAAAEYPAHERELTTACRAAVGFNAANSAFSNWVLAAAAAASRAADYAAIVMVRDITAADAAASAAAAAEAYAAYATATATAFGAAARAPFWAAVSADATRVEEGAAASAVAGSPLWPSGQPYQLQSLWQEMKAALLAAGQDWDVCTDWYDDRLEGRVREEERELAYVRIGNDLWEQGPSIVNAEIKKRIALHEPPPFGWQSSFDQPSRQRFPAATIYDGRSSFIAQPPFALIHEPPPIEAIPEQVPAAIPEIPPQRPAALEPVWSNGKLVLPSDPASTDGDPSAFVAALKVLRAEIAELADDADGEANIDKRSIIYLRRKAEGIPEHAPVQDELFRLAHAKEFLEGYAKTVNEEWPDFLAQRFHALTLHFDRTVRQFPKWRDFVRNAEKDRLTPEQAAEVPALANAMILALRDEEARSLIDSAVPSALETLQAPLQGEIERVEQALDPIETGKLLLAQDIVESVANIMKRIAEAALAAKHFGSKYGQKWKEGFAKEALSSAEKDGGKAYVWMKRTLILMAGTEALALLSQFSWLKPILSLLGH